MNFQPSQSQLSGSSYSSSGESQLNALQVYGLLSIDIKQLESNLQQINSQLNSSIQSLQTQLNSLNSSLTTIQNDLQAQINALNFTQNTQQQSIDTLVSNVNEQTQIIESVKEDIDDKLLPMHDSAQQIFFDSVWKWSFGVARISSNGVGTIIMASTSSTFDSQYWHVCDGSSISSQYSLLRSLIGSNYPDLRSKFVRGADTTRQRSVNSYQTQQVGMHFHGTFMHALADRFVQANASTIDGGGGSNPVSGSREFISKPINAKPVGPQSGTLYDWIKYGYNNQNQWESWSSSTASTWNSTFLFDQNDQLSSNEYFNIVSYNAYESLLGRFNSQDKRSFLQMTNWAMDQFIRPFESNDIRSMQYDVHFESENISNKLSDTEYPSSFNNDKDTRPENYAVAYFIKHQL